MKDCYDILQTKYYERLSGALLANGNEVKVYDSSAVPENANYPYVTLGQINSTAIGEVSRDTYGQDLYFELSIWTKFENSFGGKKQAGIIADQVLNLVVTRQAGYFDLSPEFYMISSELANSQTVEELSNTGMIVRRILRFKHLISE